MREAPLRGSARLLAALGILAYAASTMTHEALGHGGYCRAAGGHTVMLTPWMEDCSFPSAAPLGVKAAGPGVQFGAGLLAWLVLSLLPRTMTRLRCFVWLYMVFDLLISSGYVAFSGVTNLGDAAELVAGHHPAVVWRAGLVLLGSAVYFLSMRAGAVELRRLAGPPGGDGRQFRLVWIPYCAAGVLACCTGALSGVLGHGAARGLAVATSFQRAMGDGTVLGLAALSSFGAASGMLALPAMQRGVSGGRSSTPADSLRWSAAWGLVAAAVVVAFVFFLGPGVR